MDVYDMQPEPGAYPDLLTAAFSAAEAVSDQQPGWVGLVFVHAVECRFQRRGGCDCRPIIIDLRAQITC